VKKLLVLITVLAGVTTSMTSAGSSSISETRDAVDRREARKCDVLLKKISRSPNADTWRNRMRAWPCLQRAEAARGPLVDAKR
jgi:hypothetical protein